MYLLAAVDLSVVGDAAVAGPIGLLAGIGGGYLFCWTQHNIFNKKGSHK